VDNHPIGKEIAQSGHSGGKSRNRAVPFFRLLFFSCHSHSENSALFFSALKLASRPGALIQARSNQGDQIVRIFALLGDCLT
jgi:hypothetical protein